MIVSFLNQKGGVGKTTLSGNVAFGLLLRGFKVVLVDSDPQQTTLTWNNIRSGDNNELPFNAIATSANSLKQLTERMIAKDGYDFVVIDGAPRMTDLARAAIIASDLIIMPMQPSGADIWATDDLKNMIEEAKHFKPSIISAVLLNRVFSNTKLSKEIISSLIENDWSFFDTSIKQRQIYAAAISEGLTIYEMPNNKEAKNEIESLIEEILKLKEIENGD